MRSVGILIADDFSPWRIEVRKILQERPDWQIVREADDGQKAVQHATELWPDIILLEIGMLS